MTPLPILYAEGADEAFAEAYLYWLTHRDKNPDALDEDLSAALKQIALHPNSGKLVRGGEGEAVRRVHLRRTGHFLYYRRREDPPAIVVLGLRHSHSEAPDR